MLRHSVAYTGVAILHRDGVEVGKSQVIYRPALYLKPDTWWSRQERASCPSVSFEENSGTGLAHRGLNI